MKLKGRRQSTNVIDTKTIDGKYTQLTGTLKAVGIKAPSRRPNELSKAADTAFRKSEARSRTRQSRPLVKKGPRIGR